MDKGWEYTTLVSELTNGLELTKQLKVHLNSVETRELILERVLLSFERALTVLNWNASSSEGQKLQHVSPDTGVPDSSISGNGSPRSEDIENCHKNHLDHKDVSKKRKVMPTWTDQVRIFSENGLEGPIDDGYSWRKYGQKDILGAKYPRSYYRCTYRNIQNCWATKQVQRSDEDPAILDITYKGKHICNPRASHGVPPPPSPEKQEAKKQINNHITQNHEPNEFLSNTRANLRVNTEDSDNTKEMLNPFTFPSTSLEFAKNGNQNSFPFSTLIGEDLLDGFYSPSFISPATSESNYFSLPPSQMVHNLQHSESEFSEIISANTSATNSPVVNLDFSVGPVNLEANFPFHTLGFFS